MSLELKIIALLCTHFIADFILQSDWMAMNKSKRNAPLLVHVLIYLACFLWMGAPYALINGAFHFVTDYFTSRVTSTLWAKNKRHWFFVVIGFDQMIHSACLILTLRLV